MNKPIWDDAPWEPLPQLEGIVRADVCVVGLGGSGLAALEELRMRGVDAVGIGARGAGAGAAGRNGGFVLAGLAKFYHETVAQLGREVAAKIYRATADEIRRQADTLPGVFNLNGSLRVAASTAELEDCRAHLAALQTDGFPVEWYRGPEGEGLLLPTDGVFQPLARVRALARRLRAQGVRLFERSPLKKLVPGQAVSDRGAVIADTVIVAVDGRLEKIFPELAPRVRTARLQMLGTAPTREVSFPRAVYWRYGYEYWQQRPDGSIALGGFRDHALEDEWTHAAEPTDFIQDKLERFLRGHLGVNAPVTHRWAGSVGYTPDNLPVLEQVRPKVWALGGYSGTGNIVGSLCGRAAAVQACGENSPWAELLERARGRSPV
ncbi:MAG TPA: FAD-binding oxidoreductase [Acidobacteriota bacterium]|nr:FAD-binding oxidoreductase [Acidobacteriota bacterium]